MTYEFAEHLPEPEPQPSARRSGLPPRKGTGTGVLDRPPGDSSSELIPVRLRFPLWFAALFLAGSIILLLFLSGRL